LRLNKLVEIMDNFNLDAALITYEWNVFYFTGVPKPAGSYLLVIKGLNPKMLVPALEYWRVSSSVSEVEILPYSSYDMPGVEIKPLIKDLSVWIFNQLKSLNVKKVGIDLSYITSLGLKVKEGITGSAEVVDIGKSISKARMIKGGEEVSVMKKALRITEESLRKTLDYLRPGIREYEVTALLEGSMRSLGAEGYAFETIVASGPNGAYPHALSGERAISNGDEVVIDMGAKFRGYCADMTRTPMIGKPLRELISVLEALDEAVAEATDAVAPGVKVSDVDAVARKVLEKRGYSKYFIHSLGHGVGIEVHEPPRVAQGIDDVLEPGMIITIEPGIYVNGKYGARIENMVLVTKSGRDTLNNMPRIV